MRWPRPSASRRHLVGLADLPILSAPNGGPSPGHARTHEASTMSDFDRNSAAAASYGRPLTRAEAAVIDEGLRAYMLRIYNYMVLGLAITGFAALGIRSEEQ